MNKSERGSFVIILVIVAALVIIGAFYYHLRSSNSPSSVSIEGSVSKPSNGWVQYTNTEDGFSVSFPSNDVVFLNVTTHNGTYNQTSSHLIQGAGLTEQEIQSRPNLIISAITPDPQWGFKTAPSPSQDPQADSNVGSITIGGVAGSIWSEKSATNDNEVQAVSGEADGYELALAFGQVADADVPSDLALLQQIAATVQFQQ